MTTPSQSATPLPHPRLRALFEALSRRNTGVDESDWENMSEEEMDHFSAAIDEVFPVSESAPIHRPEVQECLDAIDKAQAARSATPLNGWIPVSESRPEGHVDVLVSTGGRYVTTRSAGWVRVLWDEAVKEKIECAVTHWQSLPKGPL